MALVLVELTGRTASSAPRANGPGGVLALRHLRPALDVVALRPRVAFVPGVAVGCVGATTRRLLAAGSRLPCVLAAHGARTLALARGSDMGIPFTLLLCGLSLGFCPLGTVQVASVAGLALVLGVAGFLEGDRDRLPAASDALSEVEKGHSVGKIVLVTS
jgi:hypothetical protein